MRWLPVAAIALALGCSHRDRELQLADVKHDDLVIGVEVTGELAAVDSTDVNPPGLTNVWNFKIANLASEGDVVKVGDPVIGFDPTDQVRELENMQNEADAAEKKLDKKRDDAALARRDDELKIAEAEATVRKASLKTVSPPDLVASLDLQELKLDEQMAQLVLDGAKSHAAQTLRSDAEEIQALSDKATYAKHRVENLKQAVAKMQVTATRAGTIVYPLNWQGEKHKVGDSVWRMESVLQIVGLGKMIGHGTVDEIDIARVEVGQVVTLRLDALPDVQLHGKVKSIAKSVEAKSSTDPSKMAKLEVAIDPTTVPLRPGMRFRGELETEKLAGVLLAPTDAVFVTPEGPVAYRETGGGLERVRLQLGKRSATMVEVKSGLAAGDRVSRTDPELAR